MNLSDTHVMCKLPVSEDPHLWPVLQTEWVEMPKAVSCLHAYLCRSRLEGGTPGLGLGGVGTVASSRMLRIRCRAWLDRCRAWLDLCRADSFLLVWGGFAGAPTKPSIADADILCEL